MSIEINTEEAPALLRIRCVGALPSPQEQAALRDGLIATGLLTADGVSLLDIREIETPDAGFRR